MAIDIRPNHNKPGNYKINKEDQSHRNKIYLYHKYFWLSLSKLKKFYKLEWLLDAVITSDIPHF